MKIIFSSHFNREFKKYSPQLRIKIWNKIESFRKNPFDASLKTHKLTGGLKNRWSFSVNYSIRILCEFINTDSVDFIDLGGHEIYK